MGPLSPSTETAMKRAAFTLLALVLVPAALMTFVLSSDRGQAAAGHFWMKLRGSYTVQERLDMYASAVQSRLKPHFDKANLAYPPKQLAFLAFKDTAVLHVYAREDAHAAWRLVHTYPILGLSGTLGPKLRQGDLQVPEGIYRVDFLNANSRFHLSIRLNYPNAFDRAMGLADGRSNLGSDIMIHGTDASIGCLAMGNEAAEDLFILAALAGKENVEIIVAPTDLRRGAPQNRDAELPWLPELYAHIKAALNRFPVHTKSG